jgi:uracil-DNA glycosylase
VNSERLLKFLSGQPHGNDYFNPWFGEDAETRQRRDNLLAFLSARQRASVLLVAEAPGYRGCRKSGVPLTDPRTLQGTTTGETEKTATRVYDALRDFSILDDVVMWNIFPFHPHPLGVPNDNRTPSVREAKQYADLVRLFAPASRKLVVAVGGRAKAGLAEVGIRAEHVPHPSRLKTKFRDGLWELVQSLPDC